MSVTAEMVLLGAVLAVAALAVLAAYWVDRASSALDLERSRRTLAEIRLRAAESILSRYNLLSKLYGGDDP